MPFFDENGNYVLEDGRVIPSQFAQAAGLVPPQISMAAEEPMMSVAGEPEPTVSPAPAMPQPAFQPRQAAHAPTAVVTPGAAVVQEGQPEQPRTPQQQAPGNPQAPLMPEDLSLNQRVNRTAARVGSLRGLNRDLAENVENMTDHAGQAAKLTYEADQRDAADKTKAFIDAGKVDVAGAEAARIAHGEMNRRTDDVEQRAMRLREDLERFEIDPNRVFRNQSAFTNLTDILGVGLGALVQAGNGGVNVALNLVRKKVEDDMNIQKDRRDTQMDLYKHLPDEIKYIRSIYDNEVAADAAERAFKYQAIENLLKAKMSQTTNVRAAAALETAYVKIHQDRVDNEEKARNSATQIALKGMELNYHRQKDKAEREAKAKERYYVQSARGRYILKGADGKPLAGPDGQPIVLDQGIDVTRLPPEQRAVVANKGVLATSLLDTAANLEKLGLGTELRTENKARVEQQAATAIANLVLGSRAISDTDAEFIVKSMGLPADMKPNSVLSWVRGQGGEDLINRLKIAAEGVDSANLQYLDQLAPHESGGRYGLAGVTAQPSKVLSSVVAGENQDPTEKLNAAEDDAMLQLRYGQPGGLKFLESENFLNPDQRERRANSGFLGQVEREVMQGVAITQMGIQTGAGNPGDAARYLRALDVVQQAKRVEDIRGKMGTERGALLRTKAYDSLEQQLEEETAELKRLQSNLRPQK
jgi:hypothetical protein